MTAFVEEYCSRLDSLNTPDDLKTLYSWFYEHQADIAQAVKHLNNRLNTAGTRYEFKPDLPCLAVGPVDGILVLAANPGWSERSNKLEDDYCRSTLDQYLQFVQDFFNVAPTVIGHRNRWWTRARHFVQGLDPSRELPIGGWDLIPFHSQSIKGKSMFSDSEIHDMTQKSVQAALRMKPRILLVASKEGSALIKSFLLDCDWLTVKSKNPIPVHRTVLGETEIIALGFQLVRARYSNADIHKVIRSLRRQNAKL